MTEQDNRHAILVTEDEMPEENLDVASVVQDRLPPFSKLLGTMAWQSRITNERAKLIAVVTQTQMVLERQASP